MEVAVDRDGRAAARDGRACPDRSRCACAARRAGCATRGPRPTSGARRPRSAARASAASAAASSGVDRAGGSSPARARCICAVNRAEIPANGRVSAVLEPERPPRLGHDPRPAVLGAGQVLLHERDREPSHRVVLPLEDPHERGVWANPASARRRRRSAAGWGPSRSSVTHLTTSAHPRPRTRSAGRRPWPALSRRPGRPRRASVTRKPSATAIRLRSRCRTASPAPSPGVGSHPLVVDERHRLRTMARVRGDDADRVGPRRAAAGQRRHVARGRPAR